MNGLNQQCAGCRPDCGRQSFGWPVGSIPDMNCNMPPSAIAPQMPMDGNWQQAGDAMWQGGDAMAQPMSFAARMECGKFPLAMSYVPIQKWSEPSPMEEGFRRGTIFRELDLPFMMGRCR